MDLSKPDSIELYNKRIAELEEYRMCLYKRKYTKDFFREYIKKAISDSNKSPNKYTNLMNIVFVAEILKVSIDLNYKTMAKYSVENSDELLLKLGKEDTLLSQKCITLLEISEFETDIFYLEDVEIQLVEYVYIHDEYDIHMEFYPNKDFEFAIINLFDVIIEMKEEIQEALSKSEPFINETYEEHFAENDWDDDDDWDD